MRGESGPLLRRIHLKSYNLQRGYYFRPSGECRSLRRWSGRPAHGPTPGVTNGFGAALWTVDFLFHNAFLQSTGINLNGGANKAEGYSPLFDNGTDVVKIGPEYYGLLAYSMLVKGGTLMTTQVTPAPANFSAYAVEETDGSTDLILSNKDPVNTLAVGVSPQNSISRASSLLMTAPAMTATKEFTLGGRSVGIDGNWEPTSNPTLPIVSNSAVVTIPPGSAQIVHME